MENYKSPKIMLLIVSYLERLYYIQLMMVTICILGSECFFCLYV